MCSLLIDNAFSTSMMRKGVTFSRTTSRNDVVDCYRNLNRTDLFSIKQRKGEFKGLVTGYARAILIAEPSFHVGKSANARIKQTQSKEVHAYVRGSFFDAFTKELDTTTLNQPLLVSYNPYLCDSFFTLERDKFGKVIKESIAPIGNRSPYNYALIQGKDVHLFNSL
ncbi:MAG TPA: hypothetical protein DG048_12765 [Pseudoalteromonas sp.]|jgi:hypothetical protein|nr:hypothetical protein [Pseudoalteromonas sp.]|tara:strand:- start:10666 stop:11166 length:501 start_codon:yes stop_codon:yes gene_type:complete